ncbi:MAG TPA: hypothetical protein VNR87_15930 [Flavisolibacter sp.]|nr:hypothetical protein [Flavisolibacter sp.]
MLMLLFMVALFLSGLTAIPIIPELSWLLFVIPKETSIHDWLLKVLAAYRQVNADDSFLFYGFDWLAFAHFILAILFIGPYVDPVKNIWVIQFGLIACMLIVPFAFVAGYLRGIPLGWQLIDCSFGIVGLLPLWIAYKKTRAIASVTTIREEVTERLFVSHQSLTL